MPAFIDIRAICIPAVALDPIRVDLPVTAGQRNLSYALPATGLKVQVPVVSSRIFAEIRVADILVTLNDDGDAGAVGVGTVFRNEPDIPSNERKRMLVVLHSSDRQWEGMKGLYLLSFETLVDVAAGAINDFDAVRGLLTGFVAVDHLRRVL